MRGINGCVLLGIALGVIIDLAEVAGGVGTGKDVKGVFIIYAIMIAVLSYVNVGVHMGKQRKRDKDGIN